MKQNFLNIVVYTGFILFLQPAKAQTISAMPAETEHCIQAIKLDKADDNKPGVNYFVVSKNVEGIRSLHNRLFLKIKIPVIYLSADKAGSFTVIDHFEKPFIKKI
jgi:hypothetical protein